MGGGLFDDVSKFHGLDLMQLFATVFELLKGLDHRFGHAAVGFLGATHYGKFITGGDTLVPVLVVETDAEETGLE